MKQVRDVVGIIFDAPMQNMSYVEYFAYVNTGGKITARTLLDLCTVLFTFAEEQEKINVKNKELIESLMPKDNVQQTEETPAKLTRAEILAKAREAKKAKKATVNVV